MRAGAELVDRSIAAIEGGNRLPDDIRELLLSAFRKYRTTPDAQLDRLLGIKPGRGQCSVARQLRMQERDHLVIGHYRKEHEGSSPYAASFDIADNLALLHGNPDDPNIADQYKALFENLMAIGVAVPKQRAIYDLLRNA